MRHNIYEAIPKLIALGHGAACFFVCSYLLAANSSLQARRQSKCPSAVLVHSGMVVAMKVKHMAAKYGIEMTNSVFLDGAACLQSANQARTLALWRVPCLPAHLYSMMSSKVYALTTPFAESARISYTKPAPITQGISAIEFSS